eukprot:scaffold271749_cov33-Tisochrysis_lutea.AAC.3
MELIAEPQRPLITCASRLSAAASASRASLRRCSSMAFSSTAARRAKVFAAVLAEFWASASQNRNRERRVSVDE